MGIRELASKRRKLSRWMLTSILLAGVIFLIVQVYTYSKGVHERHKQLSETKRSVVTAHVNLALNLYRQIAKDDQQANIVFSPAALSSVLGQLLLGSRGTTSAEIIRLLAANANQSRDNLHGLLRQLSRVLASRDEARCCVYVVGGLFIDDKYGISEDFQRKLMFFYDIEAINVQLKSEPESSRAFINKWVKDITDNRLEGIPDKDIPPPDSYLLAINVAYFKRDWFWKFKPFPVVRKQFFVSETETVMVNMAHVVGTFPIAFVAELNAQVLKISDADSSLVLVLVLPRDVVGIHETERRLTSEALHSVGKRLARNRMGVCLCMPACRLASTLSFKETLQQLGVRDLFQRNKADLAYISDSAELYVVDVIHTAKVEIHDEAKGEDTADFVNKEASMDNKFVFRADHPFLFYVLDERSGSVLFLGRFMKPVVA